MQRHEKSVTARVQTPCMAAQAVPQASIRQDQQHGCYAIPVQVRSLLTVALSRMDYRGFTTALLEVGGGWVALRKVMEGRHCCNL